MTGHLKKILIISSTLLLVSCSSFETIKTKNSGYDKNFKTCLKPESFLEEKITLKLSILVGFAGKVLTSSVEGENVPLSKETSECLKARIKEASFEPREGAGIFWIREKLELQRD